MRYPAWVRADGFPLSWRHYVYGMRKMSAADLRDSLARVSDVRVAHHAGDKDYREWRRQLMRELR